MSRSGSYINPTNAFNGTSSQTLSIGSSFASSYRWTSIFNTVSNLFRVLVGNVATVSADTKLEISATTTTLTNTTVNIESSDIRVNNKKMLNVQFWGRPTAPNTTVTQRIHWYSAYRSGSQPSNENPLYVYKYPVDYIITHVSYMFDTDNDVATFTHAFAITNNTGSNTPNFVFDSVNSFQKIAGADRCGMLTLATPVRVNSTESVNMSVFSSNSSTPEFGVVCYGYQV